VFFRGERTYRKIEMVEEMKKTRPIVLVKNRRQFEGEKNEGNIG
jgi:hypothetical protein